MNCNVLSVWPLVDGRWDGGQVVLQSHFSDAQTVGLSTYGGMLKPGSTDCRRRNLAETEPKVILEEVSAP